jgi:hypothetical protein
MLRFGYDLTIECRTLLVGQTNNIRITFIPAYNLEIPFGHTKHSHSKKHNIYLETEDRDRGKYKFPVIGSA